MKALFRHFDIDNTGKISKHNLSQAFTQAGKKIT